VNIHTNIHVNIEPLRIKHYIYKTIEALNKEITAKSAKVEIDESCDVIVDYNPAYLESILLNFLFNAIRFSHPNRRPIIELRCFNANDQLVLQISDNGIGINMEKHGDELFGMYKTFTDNPESKGIGL